MIGPIGDFQSRLLAWYNRARRDLPWRVTSSQNSISLPDPYHVLLSETMLQQTQVATVIPYFRRFIQSFPRIQDLAGADLQNVLRLWQGLGYYSRARNLHRCAQTISTEHGGTVPSDVDMLLTLPGVGRYTAGAIASLAFDRSAPILDGNVTRVLCRLDQIETDPRTKDVQALLWRRAADILPEKCVGDFNSALMELGATVCTPRNPQCLICPVRDHCQAQAAGVQERIPVPKKVKPTPLLHRVVLCVKDAADRYLIEQRPADGRWAGMWQFKTLDLAGTRPTVGKVAKLAGLQITRPRPIGAITHALTHRRYQFDVFSCRIVSPVAAGGTWANLGELDRYPLPKPHVDVARMLGK
ncbi:MAG: A/G-specific adenine glycosylase [Phycisphaerae bacterium]|nr:A/G-specific adenine glycosylase [Tepidisphaeraceae bacterium]